MVRSSDIQGPDEGQTGSCSDTDTDSIDGRYPKISKKGWRAIASCFLVVAVAICIGILVGVKYSQDNQSGLLFGSLSVGQVCNGTLYPGLCTNTLNGTNLNNPQAYVTVSMNSSLTPTHQAVGNFTALRDACVLRSGMAYSTLQMCIDMYQDSMHAIQTSIMIVSQFNLQTRVSQINDIQQYMSAALTYHFTCLEGLEEQGLYNGNNATSVFAVKNAEQITMLLSNALSLVDHLNNLTYISPTGRRLLAVPGPEFGCQESIATKYSSTRQLIMDEDIPDENFPTWLSKKDRHLLQSANTFADAVVALDGSGDYTSVQAAVNSAPSYLSGRYVIHIKRGTYKEQVTVPLDKERLMFLGDGAGVTIITGNISSTNNLVAPMFTASVTIQGSGFIGKNLTISNTAGNNASQAVALRVTSQQSAFCGLSIEGYQDSLYAHTMQQFYRECTIYGTVDYIFGSAAAIFQNCGLRARVGRPGQNITFTASGISSILVQRTAGFGFLSCTVDATSELKTAGVAKFPAFLGRPWHAYARTVFISSQLGDLVNPLGWSPWVLNNTDSTNGKVVDTSTVIYGEYSNFGPGANSTNRVPWSKQLSLRDAESYTSDNFISGSSWLPATGIPYSNSL